MNKENHNKYNEPTISEIEEYKNRLIQNRNKKEIIEVKFT